MLEYLSSAKFKLIFFCLVFIISFQFLLAQENTSIKQYHSPRKATLYSTFLPGLGQAYNKKYWKIPIVYGALAGTTYFTVNNYNQFITYRDAYKAVTDNDPNTIVTNKELKNYSSTQLLEGARFYRKNLDISVIALFAVYVLNIIDANVDAHLFSFDISENTSMIIKPSIFHFSQNNYPIQLNFAINF